MRISDVDYSVLSQNKLIFSILKFGWWKFKKYYIRDVR